MIHLRALCCRVLIFVLVTSLGLRAKAEQNAGYMVIFANKCGKDEWSVACLDLALVSIPPPSSTSYHNQLAVVWATLFPQATLAVPPSLLLGQKPPAVSTSVNPAPNMDSSLLFTQFIEHCQIGGLSVYPMLKLTPSSGLTRFEGISSTERSPVLVLELEKPDFRTSWKQFTKLAADCFGKATDMPFRVDGNDLTSDFFWREHVPHTLSHGMTKVSLQKYFPDRGALLYRCEAENYQGMAQTFLDFLTRP